MEKRSSTRKRTIKIVDAAPDKDVKTEDEPVAKRGRGRPKMKEPVVQEDEPNVKRRGRSKKVDTDMTVKTELDIDHSQNNTQIKTTGKRGRKKEAQIKEEIVEDDDQEPSTSNGNVAKKAEKKSKVSQKKVKEESEEKTAPAKAPGGKKNKSNASKGKNNSRMSSEGKENIDSSNIPGKSGIKSGVDRTVVVKGRAAVDALCPIAKQSHVFEEDDDIWDCMLNQTNIQFNNNKYYLIQLLKDDTQDSYSVWMRWGRVGANGQNSLVPCGKNVEKAKDLFMKKFSDKTKNEWYMRMAFEKVPGKYDLLAMDYSVGQDTPDSGAALEKAKEARKKLKCKLEARVRALIELICDVRTMEETVIEMKYDAKKAPLGKLTTDQIKAGYLALKRIDDLTRSDKCSQKDLVQACNDFYTRVPHYFGMKVPPLIRTRDEIREKMALLEALGDIQAALNVLDQPIDINLHPADQHYNGLQCNMTPLESDSSDFKVIQKYLESTHGKTHTNYHLELLEAFACNKESEQKRFKNVGNCMLLWHGSRLSNWAGILSQGLRIAPPEAPSTGYMFGKGIYFADMVSKSANYCWATQRSSVGLLLLSEVALGKTNNLNNADYNANKLPKGCNSVKGCGRIAPDPKNFTTLSDGTVVPMGPASESEANNGYSLIYNEYIVYDPAQVRTRFLLKVKFNFKY
ncbi:LOW QUALITY PROTEIN: poly [ADP-ribose] polymerase 2 [Procambarus clarkii]|uniref:LOW QUALITY PROTEIN: poly [ADP-ribose] polymerase 2 n=1 Tax=Procambarus clarkii TaxID=6728 RepID=UPI0037433AA4